MGRGGEHWDLPRSGVGFPVSERAVEGRGSGREQDRVWMGGGWGKDREWMGKGRGGLEEASSVMWAGSVW